MTTNSASPPWASPGLFPPKPADSEYGYISGRKFNRCSREELIAKCRKHPVFLVWTPETDAVAPSVSIPFLFDALKSQSRLSYKRLLIFSLIYLLAWAAAIIHGGEMPGGMTLLMVFIGVIWLGESIWGLYRIKSLTPDKAAGRIADIRFAVWLQSQTVIFTWVLSGLLAVIMIAQYIVGLQMSYAYAGLVKEAVRDYGEHWRLLTGTMLHSGIIHIAFNGLALVVLGKIVEALGHYSYLAIVFLLSALSGSVFSLFLMPDAASVGASGGLLGLIGFLAVLGYRRRQILPKRFVRSMFISIGLIAVSGIIAYDFIDNAAHFGGLTAGAILGLLLVTKSNYSLPLSPGRVIKAVGIVATAVILIMASVTMWILINSLWQ